MQAAFLRVKLAKLDAWNAKRREIANQYTSLLEAADIVLPRAPEYAEPVWHLYVIRSKQRDVLKVHLENHGVSTVIHYPKPPHRQRCYHDYENQSLPMAEMLAAEVLSLPMYPELNAEESNHVAASIRGLSSVGDSV